MKTLPLLFHAVILLFAIGITITVILISSRRRSAPGATSMIVFALALFFWGISDFLCRIGAPPTEKFWFSVAAFSATVAPTAVLTFSVEYTERGYCLTRRILALMVLEPVLAQVLFWVSPAHVSSYAGQAGEAVGANAFDCPWLRINTIYSYSLTLIAIILMLQVFFHRLGVYRSQSGAILIGALVPVAAFIAIQAGFDPTPDFDFTLIAYTITGLFFTFSLANYHLLDLVPIPREIVVEEMKDGWMVLDTKNRILDLNPAAEKLIGLLHRELYGQPAEKVLNDWPNLMKCDGDNVSVLDEVGSVKIRDEWRYLNLRAHSLTDRKGKFIGHIVIWRDITDRRKADESRQRARDEMFVLLRAIYGAASRAQGAEDFLAAAIYQIVYTFQSHSCVILLQEKSLVGSEADCLLLAAHHGLSAEAVNSMSSIKVSSLPKENNALAWVLEHREPLLIKDVRTDPNVPEPMKQMGHLSLLIIPMVIDGNVLGMIGLTRKKKLTYRTDEIARLTALAEEIATLVHSDRRRQMATILAERQRLVRDLHDAVTQKLYGLVTLTEAAQAGAKAGSADMPMNILSRISEHARQALKEMRLFLYELQPVDLEHEGLVAILHQRLAAVEGRADIKARFIADKNLSLSLERQVELYHIAQEALNNVLRHARATSVTVWLKQKKDMIALEIADNGSGFDTRQDDKGGLGLRHMQERASRIGGRFKIISKAGKGTKITVTIPRNGQSL